MSLPKTILVPVDFSEASERALVYALDLAKSTGGTVHVMHAFELPIIGFPDGTLVATAEMAAKIVDSAQSSLSALVAKYESTSVPLTAALKQADPRAAILAVAKELDAELVVMGTHGRRGLAHALIGSVAESVVRTSPIPVLTLREPKR
jgi:nucleotide-binding universal stress UspA family protein